MLAAPFPYGFIGQQFTSACVHIHIADLTQVT